MATEPDSAYQARYQKSKDVIGWIKNCVYSPTGRKWVRKAGVIFQSAMLKILLNLLPRKMTSKTMSCIYQLANVVCTVKQSSPAFVILCWRKIDDTARLVFVRLLMNDRRMFRRRRSLRSCQMFGSPLNKPSLRSMVFGLILPMFLRYCALPATLIRIWRTLSQCRSNYV
jgi:hypothetical protein